MIRFLAFCASLALAGCAGTPAHSLAHPLELRLAPASLGRELALQQQLIFDAGGEQRSMEALLEVDAEGVALAVQAAGQSALVLQWDGKRLQQERAPWLPPQVRGERVLSDLQLTYWPAEAIRAALPAGWTLDEEQGLRHLRDRGQEVATVRSISAERIEITSHRDGVRLTIISAPMAQAAP